MCFILKFLFLQKHLANNFLLHTQHQKRCFKIHFNDITSKVQLPHYPTAPSSARFNAISDHPRVVEFLRGCGPQSGAAPVRIPIIFRPRPYRVRGGGGFSVGPAL
jgi:hypothetical protein